MRNILFFCFSSSSSSLLLASFDFDAFEFVDFSLSFSHQNHLTLHCTEAYNSSPTHNIFSTVGSVSATTHLFYAHIDSCVGFKMRTNQKKNYKTNYARFPHTVRQIDTLHPFEYSGAELCEADQPTCNIGPVIYFMENLVLVSLLLLFAMTTTVNTKHLNNYLLYQSIS